MSTSRRGFLARTGAAVLGALTLQQPSIVQGIQREDGLIVPEAGKIVVATEVPTRASFGDLSFYLTEYSLEQRLEPVWLLDGSLRRESILGAPPEIVLRGVLTEASFQAKSFNLLGYGPVVATLSVVRPGDQVG